MRETGKDVNEIGADMELLTMFMFCCVRSACRADEVTFDLGFERFADGIDLSEFNRFQEHELVGEDGSKKKGQIKYFENYFLAYVDGYQITQLFLHIF